MVYKVMSGMEEDFTECGDLPDTTRSRFWSASASYSAARHTPPLVSHPPPAAAAGQMSGIRGNRGREKRRREELEEEEEEEEEEERRRMECPAWEEDADPEISYGEKSAEKTADTGVSGGAAVDVFARLAAKERDLILAAELGKALLLKNEELSKQNEKLSEEYSVRIEELEQEKYQLKRQLEVAEEEYQLRLTELQGDVIHLRETLVRQETVLRIQERERSQVIAELTEQNHKLTLELREARTTEKELRDQIIRMSQQFSQKRSSMQEHFLQVESLREEIDMVLTKKAELERQIQSMMADRENMNSSLDISVERIHHLERKQREQEGIIRSSEREVSELRSSNHHLLERLDNLSRSGSTSPSLRMSLQSELEMSGSDSDKSMRRTCDVIDELDEDYEIDDVDADVTFQGREEMRELSCEVLSAYSQLTNMCSLIRQRQAGRKRAGDSIETSSSTSSEGVYSVKLGLLTSVVSEIRALMHSLLRNESSSGEGCCVCGRNKDDKLQLEAKLHQTMEQMERGKMSLRQAELVVKRREEEITGIKNKLTLLETRLAAAEEERMVLKTDLEQAATSRDQTIKRAWETRDSAVERKNTAEIELARARIDVLQVNSQLLEAVQQKVTISQQLEEWETDLHLVIGQRLATDEGNSCTNNSSSNNNEKMNKQNNGNSVQNTLSRQNSRIIAFFQRT